MAAWFGPAARRQRDREFGPIDASPLPSLPGCAGGGVTRLGRRRLTRADVALALRPGNSRVVPGAVRDDA